MNEDETATVQKLITELDALVPKDGARVQLSQYGGGPDESRIIATRHGYLRLGIEFLRAAYASPSGESPTQVTVDLDYLLTEDSDVGFDWFERVESLPAPREPSTNRSWFSPAVFVVFALVCIGILVLIGIATVGQWLFRL